MECFQNAVGDPPAIGSVITVKHARRHANGRLKDPVFWRERTDTTWDEISESHSVASHNKVCQHR